LRLLRKKQSKKRLFLIYRETPEKCFLNILGTFFLGAAKNQLDENIMENIPSLKKFLQIPYDELEAMNIQAAKDAKTLSEGELKAKYTEYLAKEKAIKAVTICFTDIEGRFQSLDYDKQYFLDLRVRCQIQIIFRQAVLDIYSIDIGYKFIF